MHRQLFVLGFVLLLATSAAAQDVVMGEIANLTNYGIRSNGTVTINFSAPANTAGQLTSATVNLVAASGGTCSGDTFSFRFFRQNPGNPSLGLYVMTAERGPFPASVGVRTVTLTPAVPVERGDLVGVIVHGSGADCDVAGDYHNGSSELQTFGDFTTGAIDAVWGTRARPWLRASSSPLAIVGYIPVVGIINGAAGSSFKTAFSVVNPSLAEPITVKFVFHKAGVAGTSSDPSTTITIPANGSASPDLLAALGVSGLGTMDVYSSGQTPVVNARVYNQAGTGTNGFTEPMVRPLEVPYDRAVLRLSIPSDLTKFRMNIGVRSLGRGAPISCAAYGPTGAGVAGATRTYGPNSFSLDSVQTFFGVAAATLQGGSVQCTVGYSGGDAILYGTVTDNETNDSAMFLGAEY